jgi:hypothetical protein
MEKFRNELKNTLISKTEKKRNPEDQDVHGNIILNKVLKKHKMGCWAASCVFNLQWVGELTLK